VNGLRISHGVLRNFLNHLNWEYNMSKFAEWFERNRKPVGYTVGGLNVLMAAVYAVNGQFGLAVLWTVIGGTILFDTYEFK
jgi:hypothetical protein